MNLDALAQLERVALEAPDDHRFAMAEIHCGTAHCLYGWADIDPWFECQPGSDIANTLGIGRENFNLLFGLGEHWTNASGPAIKAEVIANIRRLRDGEPLVSYPTKFPPTFVECPIPCR